MSLIVCWYVYEFIIDSADCVCSGKINKSAKSENHYFKSNNEWFYKKENKIDIYSLMRIKNIFNSNLTPIQTQIINVYHMPQILNISCVCK